MKPDDGTLHGSSDATILSLLQDWEPRLGAPSCREGCFACCAGLITVHSAEARELLRGLESSNPESLAQKRATWSRDNEYLLAEDRGPFARPCPLLDEGRCSVYGSRPLVCRTQAVWHEAKFCGVPGIDPCTPAELLGERAGGLLQFGLEELERGRWPFWGALSLVMELSLIGGEDYLAGANITRRLGDAPLERGLIETPPGSDRVEARAWFEERLGLHRHKLANSAWPYGQPRAADVDTRDALSPHFLGGPPTG